MNDRVITKHKKSIAHQILLLIRDHPEGIRRLDILKAFTSTPERNLDGTLMWLRKSGLVIKTAERGMWYPVTHDDDVSDWYREIAADLTIELRDLHYEAQEFHLAKRLKEIFGEE